MSGRLIWLILAVFFIFGALTAGVYPPANYGGDEFWRIKTAKELGQGEPFVTPRLYFYPLRLTGLALGFSLLSGRLYSVIMGVAVLLLTYLIGRRLFDEKTGVFSAGLLAVNFVFLWHARTVSMELASAAVVMLSVYLLIIAREYEAARPRAMLLASSGLVLCLSINVHPNNLQYVLTVPLIYIALYRKKAFSPDSLYYLSGFILSFGAWYAFIYSRGASGGIEGLLKAYPFPILNRNFFSLFINSLTGFPRDYLASYPRLAQAFFPSKIGFYPFAIAFALLLTGSLFTVNRLKTLLIVSFVSATLFINYFITDHFGYWHMAEFFPAFALIAGASISGISQKARQNIIGTIFLLAFVLAGAVDQALVTAEAAKYDFKALTRAVAAKVPSGGKVLGAELYYPAIGDRLVVFSFLSVDKPGSACLPFEEQARKTGAKYIIADEILMSFAVSSCGEAYQKEIIRYLNLKCKFLGGLRAEYPAFWAEGNMLRSISVFEMGM